MADDKGLVLVTGGTGFVGGWCIVRLLQDGWRVRTTVRDLKREAEVRANVATQIEPGDRLEFAVADLGSDTGWAEAVAGCDYVLHVASPIGGSTSDADMLAPARDGTLRVLRAAVAAGVKRVVTTSSMAAVAYGHPPERYRPGARPFDETDWTDPTAADAAPYTRSKAIAERAARDFMSAEGGATEFASVNPAGIFGPTLGRDFSPSLQIVQRLLAGAMPAIPRLGFAVVDVRDLADLHLLAMTRPEAAGGRYPAGGEFVWFEDIARLLRERLPQADAAKVPTRRMPDWLLKLLARFNPELRAIAGEVGRKRAMSQATSVALGWSPRPWEDSIVDSAKSLIAVGAV